MRLRHAFLTVLLAAAGTITPIATASAVPAAGYSQVTGVGEPSALESANCNYEYQLNYWEGHFSGSLKVKNIGTSGVSGWRVEFDLSTGSHITGTWGGIFLSSSGHIEVDNESWNPDINPGQYVDIGFTGTMSSSSVTLLNVKLNGVTCTV